MSTVSTISTGVFNKEIFDKAMEDIRKRENWRCAYLDGNNRFYAQTEFTGHMYFGSPYETADSCGNCNGACCDSCKILWTLEERVGDTDELKEFTTVITKEFSDTDAVLEAWKEHCEKNNIPW